MKKNEEIIVLEPNRDGVYEDSGKIEKLQPRKRRPKPNPPIVQFLNGFSKGANLINILRGIVNGRF